MMFAMDGQILLTQGMGWQDHGAEEPTTTDATCLVASIAKTLTAETLLAMGAEGHIDLDDFTTLSDWDRRCRWLTGSASMSGGGTLDDGTVVEPLRCGTPISLRQVLQHRVQGEPDAPEDDDGWALIALGNTDGIDRGNPLHKVEVEKSPLAARFFNLFVAD